MRLNNVSIQYLCRIDLTVVLGFRVLSEAERTAALYSLLQHSTQVQIRFFITVLQQMARSDPMTALLSPAVGSSMQAQMEAKLASMGLKSPAHPTSPSVRSFSTNAGSRQSFDPSTYLSPDTAQSGDAASTLAQQRAKLKADNTTAHRLSAPGPLHSGGLRPTSLWTQSSLQQVAERAPSPATSDLAPPSQGSIRPKSMDVGGLNQFNRNPRSSTGPSDDNSGSHEVEINLMQDLRLNEQLSPMIGGNWASMVNTPLVPMFSEGNALGNNNGMDAAAAKLANWSMRNSSSSGVVLDDAKKFRRESKGSSPGPGNPQGSPNGMSRALPKESNGTPDKVVGRSTAGAWRAGARSPATSSAMSPRYPASDAGSNATSNFSGSAMSPGMGGLGMGMGNFGMYGGMPNLVGMPGMPATLEQQILAAQLNGAFSPGLGGFPNGSPMGMGNFGMGMGQMGMGMGVQGQPGGLAGSNNGRGSPANSRVGFGTRQFTKQARPAAKPKVQLKDDDINESLLNDIPAWFHVLRLHKYTPVVSGKSWRELVVMNDSELEKLGISALGARRKLLKHFCVVREKFNIPHPEGMGGPEDSEGEQGEGEQGENTEEKQ